MRNIKKKRNNRYRKYLFEIKMERFSVPSLADGSENLMRSISDIISASRTMIPFRTTPQAIRFAETTEIAEFDKIAKHRPIKRKGERRQLSNFMIIAELK